MVFHIYFRKSSGDAVAEYFVLILGSRIVGAIDAGYPIMSRASNCLCPKKCSVCYIHNIQVWQKILHDYIDSTFRNSTKVFSIKVGRGLS